MSTPSSAIYSRNITVVKGGQHASVVPAASIAMMMLAVNCIHRPQCFTYCKELNWMRHNRTEYRCSNRLQINSSILNPELFGIAERRNLCCWVCSRVYFLAYISRSSSREWHQRRHPSLSKPTLGTIKASSPLLFHTVLRHQSIHPWQ